MRAAPGFRGRSIAFDLDDFTEPFTLRRARSAGVAMEGGGMADSGNPTEILSYKAPWGLQTILGLGFFLILLFMVNAIAGSLWLATRNLPVDAVIFFAMFMIGAILLFYAGIFLFAASHSEVHIGDDKAVLVLPNWRGPTPFFPYTECRVAFQDLAAVETRSEVYRYLVIPVIVRSACLVRKDGVRLTLGYVQEDPQDPWIPFHTIAEQIATKAGVPIVDRGIVECQPGLRALIQDEPGWDAPAIAAERLEKVRKAEKLGWTVLGALIAIIALASVAFQATRLFG
jgi:hypothetical protein